MYAPGTEYRGTRLTATSVLNTVTSLLQPLFLVARMNGHTFSCKKPSLIRSLVNTANFFVPLVIVLMRFHYLSNVCAWFLWKDLKSLIWIYVHVDVSSTHIYNRHNVTLFTPLLADILMKWKVHSEREHGTLYFTV